MPHTKPVHIFIGNMVAILWDDRCTLVVRHDDKTTGIALDKAGPLRILSEDEAKQLLA